MHVAPLTLCRVLSASILSIGIECYSLKHLLFNTDLYLVLQKLHATLEGLKCAFPALAIWFLLFYSLPNIHN